MISTIKNKRTFGVVFLLISLILSIAGCAAYRYVSPFNNYDHDKHEKALLDRDKDCFNCHKVDIDEPDLQKKLEMLKASLKNNKDKQFEKEMCHTCHLDGRVDDYQVSPNNCKLCHADMLKILPQSHDSLWRNNHRLQAQVSDKDCMRCHDRWYCNNCHTSTDMSKSNMHPRTFKVGHISAVMADPASCSSCHRNSFCIDCHTTR